MPKTRGLQRAQLLQTQQPSGGRTAAPDGLDRSQADGLAVLMDAYLVRLAVKHQSPRTIETRRRALVAFVKWCQERELMQPKQITRPILESYQRHLWHHRTKAEKPLAVGTQIGRLAAVRGLFKWLCREAWLDADPAAHLEMPKEEHRLPADTLSESEVAAILAVPNVADPLGIRDRTMLELLYSTGIRRAELVRVQLRDLHRERRTLHVEGKGNKERIVPVGERALQWIERYLAEVRPLLHIHADEQALFLTGYGRAFSANSLGNLIKANIKKAHPGRAGNCHLLRHACATHMLEHGADVRIIQQLLGHSKLETTQVYTEVSIKLLQDVHARTHPSSQAATTAATEAHDDLADGTAEG
ncbi:MAG: site-specific tyrosine recombinase XerC [Verrucomicrobiaceae bacterium]|nr:site-specific tyrosine recombinase XerC [Verrucomicrobiaceae bacterium]